MGNHAPFDHLAGMGLHGEGDASGAWSGQAPDRHGVEQGHGLSPAAGRFPGTARSRAKGVQNHGSRSGTAWFSGIRSRGCGAAHGPGGFAATVAGMPCGFGATGGAGWRKCHMASPPQWRGYHTVAGIPCGWEVTWLWGHGRRRVWHPRHCGSEETCGRAATVALPPWEAADAAPPHRLRARTKKMRCIAAAHSLLAFRV